MIAERMKDCTRCGQLKPWSAYYACKKWEDGTMRCPQSRCKDCMAEIMRERRPRNSAEREWHKAWQRKAYRRWRQDPEWVAQRRLQDREARRKRNGTPPERFRVVITEPSGRSPTLPLPPFAAWLRSELARRNLPCERLAYACGITSRAIYRLLNEESPNVELDTVDRITLALDARIDDVYGEAA